MADQKISALNAKTTVHDTDLFALVDIVAAPDETKKITGAHMKAAMVAGHKDLTTGVHGVGAGTIAKTSDITATKLDDFAAPDDNTDLDASAAKHGLMPKADSVKLAAIEAAADVTDATNVAAAGAVMDADFAAADQIMVGTGAGTHGQVTLAASQFLAKKAAGAATNVTAAEARTILNVADGADVTGSNAPQAHKASHQNGGGDEVSVAGLSGLLADDQHVLDAEVVAAVKAGNYVPRTYVWFVSGTVATGTEQGPTFRMKRATIVEDIELHVKTAPTGAALIVDINEAGTTLFSTKPEIDISGTTEDDNHVFSDTNLAAAAELTMDIDQVGSTVAGADLTVLLHCKELVI